MSAPDRSDGERAPRTSLEDVVVVPYLRKRHALPEFESEAIHDWFGLKGEA